MSNFMHPYPDEGLEIHRLVVPERTTVALAERILLATLANGQAMGSQSRVEKSFELAEAFLKHVETRAKK